MLIIKLIIKSCEVFNSMLNGLLLRSGSVNVCFFLLLSLMG